MTEQGQEYRGNETPLETAVDQAPTNPYEGKVVVRVGTPFFKKDDRVLAILDKDSTIGDAIEEALGAAPPEVADSIKRMMKVKDQYQVRANNAPKGERTRLNEVATEETTEDGTQRYKVVDIDIMTVQRGGLYKLLG